MMNEIYYGQFKDVKNMLWTVRIYKKDYSGATQELLLGGDPLIINYEDDGDIFKSVVYSQCTIKVLTNKILNIYSKNIFDVKVEVYKENDLYWFGYNTPNVYSSDYYSEVDEVEINAIDSLAALKYVNYQNFIYNNTLNCHIELILNQINPSRWDMTQHLQLMLVSYMNQDEGDFQIKQYKVFSDKSVDITIRNINTGDEGTVEIKNDFSIWYIDSNYNDWIEIFNEIPICEGVFTYNGSILKITTYSKEWCNIPTVEYTKYFDTITDIAPDSNITFNELLFNLLSYTHENPIIEYYNTFDNFNNNILTELEANESIFFDEEDEPLKVNEIVDEICKFLNCRLIQWQDRYYLYNTEEYAYNYFKTANNTMVTFTSSGSTEHYQDNYIDNVEIAENSSQIEMNDVYTEVKVQSTKKNYDETVIDVEPEVKEYSTTQETEITVGNYKYRVNRTKGTLNTVFNGIEIIQTQWAWNKNEKFPTPSPEDYMMWYYPQLTTSLLKDWATYEYTVQPMMKSFFPNVHFEGRVNFNRYMVLNMNMMISKGTRQYGIIRQDSDHDTVNTENYQEEPILNRHGYPLLTGELRIGNKYWNGTSWENSRVCFQLDFETDNGIKEDNWYSLGNTISFDSNFNERGYLVTLPADVDFNGFLELKIFRSHPTKIYGYETINQREHTYTWSELIANPNLLDGFTLYRVWNSYWDSCFYRLKDIKLNYIFESKNKKEEEDNDLIYSTKINDTNYNVYEKKDLKMLLNSHNYEKSNNQSYSEVFKGNQLMLTYFDKGKNIRPEQHLLNRYMDYYQDPRLIHSNTFKLDGITPMSTLKLPYFNNYFIIGSCEIDVKYNTINTKCYEI